MKLSLRELAKGEGRLSRKGYWLYFLAPGLGLALLTWILLGAMFELLYGKAILILLFPWLLFFATADGQNIRRYHDIGHSGRIYRIARPLVFLLPGLAFFLQWVLPAQMASAGDMSALVFMAQQDFRGLWMTPTTIGLLGLTGAIIIFNVAYLSAMPGQKGPNAHGPDPESGASMFATGEAAPGEGDDPVKRALAAYQAQQAKAAPSVKVGAAMVTPMRAAPAGGGFGKRRSS